MKKETYDVPDMHCIGCQMGVQRLLKKTDGVKKVDILFGESRLVVTYDETILGQSDIIDVVKRFGYRALLGTNQE
ncbi:MAG: heavy-metal-associated domain-containing protein [Acholeplasmataceae bacterium]|nr:heavy-metal-associated domain-containing protein [Acholeplasmataceae bacterium]